MLTKIPLMYIVSYFNLGVLELCLGRLRPPKPPHGDGTEHGAFPLWCSRVERRFVNVHCISSLAT